MANKGGFIGQDGLNAPDEPTGVNAHTAFDTQVEVNFTAPSDVGGSAITGYQVQSNNGDGTWYSSYDIANASYDSKSFSVAAQEGNSRSLFIKPDGLSFYITGVNNDTVYQYTMTTAWDISTGSYASKSFSVAGQELNPNSVFFKSDGTKLYVMGSTGDDINQYSLSTAWDISTASFDSVTFSVASQETTPNDLQFKSDGTKLYVSGFSNKVYQYGLSTAWDVSTASYDTAFADVSGQGSNIQSTTFSADGASLFVSFNSTAGVVYKYTLSTAWDVSTASYSSVSFSPVESITGAVVGLVFGSSGSKMYLMDSGTDLIYQYTTGQVDYPTSSPVTITGLTNGTSYTFNVWAINAFGWSSPSDASASVTPQASRGVFGNSQETVRATMDLIIIPTTGNATDFGDMTTTAARGGTGSTSSTTRGLFMGGDNVNIIDYITIATEGNAIDFGDFTTVKQYGPGSFSNSTRAIAGGGSNNTLEYVTIATTGNATDFGDDYLNYVFDVAGAANSTRGLLAGGFYSATNNSTNTIRYVTIATTGNTTDFGDLTVSRGGLGGASNATRGMFFGGGSGTNVGTPQNTVDYVTIASTGNAVDFGDLSATARGLKSVASQIRAVTHLGNSGGNTNILEFFTIASIGNAVDFGDLINASSYIRGACSNSHGGLS